MDQYNNWDDIGTSNRNVPLPDEDFDQYFSEYHEVDNLFNETLTGLQDLDVPSGFVHQELKQQQQQQKSSHHQPKHSRKISGTAIFGYSDHNKELSISGLTADLYNAKQSVDLGKSISPVELMRTMPQPSSDTQLPPPPIDFNFPNEDISKPILLMEEDEFEEEKVQEELKRRQKDDKEQDYIVTSENPNCYKFPPSPSPSRYNNANSNNSNNVPNNYHSVTNYSVKYLQGLRFNQSKGPVNYVDDIEPLLEPTSSQQQNRQFQQHSQGQQESSHNNQSNRYHFHSHQQQQGSPNTTKFICSSPSRLSPPHSSKAIYKYVPIPVQDPITYKKQSDVIQQFQQQHFNIKNNYNAYLPPPSPPTLSNGSPEWQSSPEPQSPSPRRAVLNNFDPNKFSSPINPQLRNDKANFYTPHFFSDSGDSSSCNNANFLNSNNNLKYQLQSSPSYHPPSLNSSPVKYYNSPVRNATFSNDDTVDINATITQITPLKNQLPSTPVRNAVKLEWSPIISPNEKASKDLKRHIQQASPRRKVKKTSLLPPGELDQYWEGPDEDKIFTCTYKNCGKKFTRRYNVRSHIQTHLSDRPFGCSYCPKKFVRQHDLNRHVKGHLEARYCRCPCGKEFARLDAMKKHRERNICVGGIASNTNNCVTKPQKKIKNEILDELTSDKLNDELSSSLSDKVLSSVN